MVKIPGKGEKKDCIKSWNRQDAFDMVLQESLVPISIVHMLCSLILLSANFIMIHTQDAL